MTYGLITPRDAESISFALYSICSTFSEGIISTFELGTHKGKTSRGIRDFFKSANRINFHTAVDNQQDFQMDSPFPECQFLIGDSLEMSDEIRNYSQHFGFIDANHGYRYVASDFLAYKDKIVKGGIIAFHDVSPFIKPFTDYQQVGSKENKYNYITCLEAVKSLGLLDDKFYGWKKILHKYDEAAPTGGVLLIEKTI